MTTAPRQRKQLPLSATLAIAAALSGACVVAIPAPQQPPGGFANARPDASESARADVEQGLRRATVRIGNGVGEVASAFIARRATKTQPR